MDNIIRSLHKRGQILCVDALTRTKQGLDDLLDNAIVILVRVTALMFTFTNVWLTICAMPFGH